MPSRTPSSEAQRLAFLQGVRQRIVELQAQRAVLQEANSPASSLADLDALLSHELALEQSLMAQRRPRPPRARDPGTSRMVAALALLASMMDDGAVGALGFVSMSLGF